ncbi:MAG TPA: hypothetical protein PKI03_19075, partial [Pseudomonadota bacterium]|nr:hypothetical protein [Pseudomonadota bacterium]
ILTEGSLEAEVPTSFNRTEQHSIQMARPSDTKKCSFTSLSPALASGLDLRAVWGSDPDNMFVVGGESVGNVTKGVIIQCNSTSAECAPLNSNINSTDSNFATNISIWGSDKNHIFVGNLQGNIIRCSAESSSCASIYQPAFSDFKSIWASDSDNIYAGGNSRGSSIHRCSSSINNCVPLIAAGRTVVSSLWGSGSEYVYAVDSNTPGVSRCRASSTTCDQLSSMGPNFQALNKVWGSDPLNVYAVGQAGMIVRCTAATSVCTPLNSGTTALLNSVWGSDAENVYAVGNGAIVRCRAGSDICEPLSFGTASEFKAVWGSDANNVYAVGTNGSIVRCSSDSGTCVTLTSGVTVSLLSVFGTDSNNIYVIGDGTILRRRL